MRRAAKVDTNQSQIITALRAMGCSVQPLHAVGAGCPDLLVGFRGENLLLEVKNRDGRGNKLTPDQQRWHRDWCGQVAVVCDVDEALAAVMAYR